MPSNRTKEIEWGPGRGMQSGPRDTRSAWCSTAAARGWAPGPCRGAGGGLSAGRGGDAAVVVAHHARRWLGGGRLGLAVGPPQIPAAARRVCQCSHPRLHHRWNSSGRFWGVVLIFSDLFYGGGTVRMVFVLSFSFIHLASRSKSKCDNLN